MRYLFLTLLLGVTLSTAVYAQPADPAQDIRDPNAASSYQALMAMRENEARMQQLIESMRSEMAQLDQAGGRSTRQQLVSQLWAEADLVDWTGIGPR